jgi:tRNA threonylcarbamoyladenosine biosynthesis protein TsaE
MNRSPGVAEASSGRLQTDAPAQTRDLGRRLGASAQPGTVLALIGPLGAGKTELTKGVAEGLGVASVVNSPTFVLMNEHPGRLRLFHVDAYRLGDASEAVAAGLLDERQAEGVTVIEWADRLAELLPDARLELVIEPSAEIADQRSIRWHAYGAQHAALAARALPHR